MAEIAKDFWAFMRVRKKFWLFPFLFTVLLFAALVLLGPGNTVTPFVYTLF